MLHQTQLEGTEAKLRAAWAESLRFTIANCHPQDAAQIMVAALDDMAAGDPPMRDPFGDMRADAAFWADCANPAELEAYFAASLKRLKNTALGITARKRLFVALWHSFPVIDRLAFLSRVDGSGQFTGGRA